MYRTVPTTVRAQTLNNFLNFFNLKKKKRTSTHVQFRSFDFRQERAGNHGNHNHPQFYPPRNPQPTAQQLYTQQIGLPAPDAQLELQMDLDRLTNF